MTTREAPLLSVVIPTHNRVKLLERALSSVKCDTAEDFEIIVVDDGSTDGTSAFLADAQAQRWTALRNERSRGVAASRNRGVAAARGTYVVFLDDDDELRPEALATIRHHCQTLPKCEFLWGARLIHEKDRSGREVGTRCDDFSSLKGPISGTDFLPYVLEIATNSAFTILRSTFEKIGGFDETLKVSEDRDLFLSLAEHNYAGRAIAKVVIDVDEHFANSLSRSLGRRIGPNFDLQVIAKHRAYLDRPEHREFMNAYLTTIFSGFLESGDRRSAMRTLRELHAAGASSRVLLRLYLRHAPEFRALKSVLRYDRLRWLRNRLTAADTG